jgi:hypothetical protein
MRFHREPNPEDGTSEIVSFFAIFPVTIDNETRWLEFVAVKKVYMLTDMWGRIWVDMCFVD